MSHDEQFYPDSFMIGGGDGACFAFREDDVDEKMENDEVAPEHNYHFSSLVTPGQRLLAGLEPDGPNIEEDTEPLDAHASDQPFGGPEGNAREIEESDGITRESDDESESIDGIFDEEYPETVESEARVPGYDDDEYMLDTNASRRTAFRPGDRVEYIGDNAWQGAQGTVVDPDAEFGSGQSESGQTLVRWDESRSPAPTWAFHEHLKLIGSRTARRSLRRDRSGRDDPRGQVPMGASTRR